MIKKRCQRCNKKISKKYNFCPYCGEEIETSEEGFGILGKNDINEETLIHGGIKLPMGLDTIFNSLLEILNGEIERAEPPKKSIKKNGISISISTFGNYPPGLKIKETGEEKLKFEQKFFDKEKAQKFSQLKREEPKTKVRRLSNKVVYELEMPEVKDIKDVSIVKLEKSIEIKAIGEKKSYMKVIPINLPIKNWGLSGGKLIVELKD